MTKILSIIVLVLAIGLISCKNGTQKNVSQAVEEKKEFPMSAEQINDRLFRELDSTEIYNDSILYGFWFQPHAACVINVFLHKDNTYEFKYVENDKENNSIDKYEKGSFTFDGEKIILSSSESRNGLFDGVIYYKHNGTCYYLTDKKEGFYLVKGSY